MAVRLVSIRRGGAFSRASASWVMAVRLVNMRMRGAFSRVSASWVMAVMFMNIRMIGAFSRASASWGQRGKTASQPVAIALDMRKRRHDKPQ